MKVKDKFTPIQQQLRSIPFSVRDKVSEDLKMLGHLCIIEIKRRIRVSSPIVVAWEHLCGVKLYVC